MRDRWAIALSASMQARSGHRPNEAGEVPIGALARASRHGRQCCDCRLFEILDTLDIAVNGGVERGNGKCVAH